MTNKYIQLKQISDSYGLYRNGSKIHLVKNIKVYDEGTMENSLKLATSDLHDLLNNEISEHDLMENNRGCV